MNELDKIKKSIFKSRTVALIVIAVIIILYIGDVTDSLSKIGSLFQKEKSDTLLIKLVDKPTDSTLEPELTESFLDPDTISIPNKLEITDLVNGFLSDEEGFSQDWSVQSSNNAIYWVTEGIKFSNDYYYGFFEKECPFIRIGYCKLTHNGRDLYKILRQRQETGKWQIVLCGPRAFVDRVYIENVRLSPEIDPGFIKDLLSKKALTQYIKGYDKINSLTDTLKYKLKFPGKKEVIVLETSSCGSAGCTITMIIEL